MIRWITGVLGTASWEKVAGFSGGTLIDVRDLVDKEGNDPCLIKRKILQGVSELQAGRTVVVACDYGVSRSNAVAAGILAIMENRSYAASMRTVMDMTGEGGIRLPTLHGVAAVVESMRHQRHASDDDAAGRRVLITGGTGYLGVPLQERLKDSRAPVAIGSKDVDLTEGPVALDLLVQELRITHLIHLAAPRDFGKNSSLGAMVTMLKNVLDVCAANTVKLVFPSSADVFSNDSPSFAFADEARPTAARTTLGQAKLLCESLIRNYAEQGMQATVIRLPVVYGGGARRPKFLHTLIEKASRDESISIHRYRNGDAIVDLLHVDDACDAVAAALDRDVSGLLHLGSGAPTSTRKLVEFINGITGRSCAITDVRIDTCMANIVLSNDRAFSLLDWRPRISLADGLSRLVAGKHTF